MGRLVLLVILSLYIIRPGDWIPGLDIRWNLIINVVGAFVMMIFLASGTAQKSWDRTWAYLASFFALMLLSSIVMQQMDTIPLYAPQMLTNILVYFLLCASVQTQQHLSFVISWFAGLALFVVYQCHLQIVSGTNMAGLGPLMRRSESVAADGFLLREETPQVLWVGVFGDPNDTGLLFVAVLPLLLARAVYVSGNAVRRVIEGFAGIALIYGIYLTNSRGTFVALLGAVAYFFILRYRSLKSLVAAAIGGFALITVGPSRLASVTSADDSAMERVYAWIEALWAFSLYPFFGLGPRHWIDWHHKTTHNSFVLAFVETGFVAYVCWLAILIIPLYAVSKSAFDSDSINDRTGYAAYGACIAGVMLSIFFISRTYVLLLYFVAACALTYVRVRDTGKYEQYLKDTTPFRLAAVAAASIVLIWITNILTTRLML